MKKKNEEKKPVSKKEAPGYAGRVGGKGDSDTAINTPGIELPAFNPPVPNRAWTEMKKDLEQGI